MKKSYLFTLLILGIALIFFNDPAQYLTLENLKLNQHRLEEFYQENGLVLIVSFITLYILIGLFLLPGSTFLSFAAGFIFGPGVGLVVVNIGSTLGATLAFLVKCG